MVYKEGTKFIEAQPKEKLAAMALRYIQKEKEVAKLMESLKEATNMPDEEKEKILKLLDAGGARTALNVSWGMVLDVGIAIWDSTACGGTCDLWGFCDDRCEKEKNED